jgi:hypothetical protein
MSLETRYDNLDVLQRYFNELIVRHSVNRPPFSLQIFKIQDVIKIVEYLNKNYLSNYKLYKYVFTSSVRLFKAIKLFYPKIYQYLKDCL